MKIKTLTAALACALPMTGAFAAALDRSGQSISSFLQPGNYAEAGISVLAADVQGQESGTSATNNKIDNMAKDYFFGSAAIKLQPTENFSFGIIYDQPFGADAKYSGDNVFVSNDSNTILGADSLAALRASTIENTFNALTTEQRVGAAVQAQGYDLTTAAGQAAYATALTSYNASEAYKNAIDTAVKAGVATKVDEGLAGVNALLGKGATNVKVTTQNLSFLFGFQPNENWNFYAGPVLQKIKGQVNLRGQAYSLFNGYDAVIPEEDAWGWLAGVAYQIPEIALKASLTYRSKIDYDINVKENISAISALSLLGMDPTTITGTPGKTSITTPQSVNLDLQSGIMADTVAFANIRWVNWKDFSIRPYQFGLTSEAVGPLVSRPNGFNLVEYSDDQWSVTTGVGRKFSDKWAGNVSVGWDSGAGNPVTTLGPTEGYWNVGLGLQYSPAPNYFVAGGVKYFWLGDAKAQTGAQSGGEEYVAKFSDNNAIAYGLKLGYRF
ncbi:long-chain fatty acid transporter [Acinetobacter populi]|jgi:long-chain fatty acid transport protein|uniref:Long-chain fatty acid transporter n=1 Tax=Acinetobacter populi TaxID=1582270 RepID=A0A1Z9Z1X1_9GAMM|nr:long-chain fatty acid transporter [Acinetobacter populi]MCH4246435.1 long-chain fatty acid transporter [Acinetobacter populi]OUY08471.1 long-chain fatty acid transporter [Acinetobacter populi]